MGYLTVNEVATLRRVSDLTVRRWIWSGRLPASKVGRLVRIKQSDLESMTRDYQSETASAVQAPRPGSAAALLEAVRRGSRHLRPGDVEELERLIEEGCERPSEARGLFG